MGSLEEKLRELGGNIAAALEELLLPAALLDADGTIRWQNKAAAALMGQPVGADLAELFAPAERVDARRTITSALRSGQAAECILPLRNAGGQYDLVHFSAAPVRCGGAVLAIFGLRYTQGTPETSPATPGHRAELTERQLVVLRLLADGRSTSEIAAELWLSQTTVRNHIANLIAALGVHSRLQAVVAASQQGLLDP